MLAVVGRCNIGKFARLPKTNLSQHTAVFIDFGPYLLDT